uniref:Uncharacterized protein n=1 Tax=Magallana gigas TaxID=29159 RepID=A0A8W8NYS6_MAGGI
MTCEQKCMIGFYACPPGFFGLDCINRCDSYCSGNESCDPVLGICIKGCKPGWSGLMCGLDKLNPQSYGDKKLIVIGVVVSCVIFLAGSIIHLMLRRRKTDGPSETSQQYTELGIINKSSNYDEINRCSIHSNL